MVDAAFAEIRETMLHVNHASFRTWNPAVSATFIYLDQSSLSPQTSGTDERIPCP
jgi:hypothetical protein